VSVGASIGIALAPTDADTPEQLLRHADAAMYSAKRTADSFWSRYPPESQPVADPVAPAGPGLRQRHRPHPAEARPAPLPHSPTRPVGG